MPNDIVIVDTNDQTPAQIAPENHRIQHYGNKIRSHITVKNTIQGITIIIGFGAGIFYKEPAAICIEKNSCGLWLSNLTSPDAARYIFLSAGGGGYGATNAIQARHGFNAAFELVSNQKNHIKKALMASGLTVLSATQLVQNLILCIAAKQELWQTGVVIGASVPTALYGTVLTIKNDLPNNVFNLKWKARRFYLNSILARQTLSEEQNKEKQRIQHYDQEFDRFARQVEANWKAIIKSARDIQISAESLNDPLRFLFQQKADYQAPTLLDKTVHYSGRGVGTALAMIFSIPFGLGTRSVLRQWGLTSPVLLYGIVGSTGLAILYGNIRFTTAAFSILEIIKDALIGKPIESLPLQLRPKLSLAVASICAAIASMSYAAANLFADEYYDGPEKEAVVFATMIGISLYHLEGFWELYPTLLSMLSTDKKERFLYQVQELATELKTYRGRFIEKVENQSGFAEIVGAKTFASTSIEKQDEVQDEVKEQEQALVTSIDFNSDSDDEDEKPVRKTWCNSITNSLCFFRSRAQHAISSPDRREALIPNMSPS